jgi:hypothetical protein
MFFLVFRKLLQYCALYIMSNKEVNLLRLQYQVSQVILTAPVHEIILLKGCIEQVPRNHSFVYKQTENWMECVEECAFVALPPPPALIQEASSPATPQHIQQRARWPDTSRTTAPPAASRSNLVSRSCRRQRKIHITTGAGRLNVLNRRIDRHLAESIAERKVFTGRSRKWSSTFCWACSFCRR